MAEYAYKILKKVLEEKSFSNAANALNLSTSAVSQTISKLEDGFGFTLLLRSRTGITLTEEGEKLLPLIEQALLLDEKIELEVSNINRQKNGSLHIGTLWSIAQTWLPDILNTFGEKYPNIQVEITEFSCTDAVKKVENNCVDVSLLSVNCAEHIATTPLYRDSVFCVVPLNFEPKNKDYVTVEEIKDYPLIVPKDDDSVDYINIFKKYNICIKPKMRVISDDSIITMVKSENGVGLIPEMILKSEAIRDKWSKLVKFYRFEPNEYRMVGIALANEPMPSHAAKLFKKQVVDYVKDRGIYNL